MAATITDNNKISNTTRTIALPGTVTYVPVPGAQGLSAYQVWIAAGNTGTVTQFLASLKGPTGTAGVGTVGPVGPAGTQGIQGVAGTAGLDGKSAYQIWLDAGNVGTIAQFIASLKGATGATGLQGPVGPTGPGGGKSAYDLWIDAGNTGTVTQFLASLKGAVGAAGTNGTNGTNGLPGTAGTNGINGAPGTSVTTATITNGQLIIGLSNSTSINAGNVFIQYTAIANSTKTITMGSTVQTLGTYPALTDAAVVSVTGGNVNYTLDGTTPSSTAGIPLVANGTYEVTSLADVIAFKAVAVSGSPVISVYFEKRS